MKKNQQSIDGFTPRTRRANSSVRAGAAVSEKKPSISASKIDNRRVKQLKEPKDEPEEDITSLIANLEIDDSDDQNEASHFRDTKSAQKERKFREKLKKFNDKREKKGKKPLSAFGFKINRIFKIFTFMAIIGLLCFGGFFGYSFLKNAAQLSKDGNILGIFQKEKLKQDSNGRTNFLIFGTSPKGWDGEDLADSIMVVSVNQETKKARTISLPRDLWVKRNCDGWLGGYAGKINETYACGKYSNGLTITDESAAESDGQKQIIESVSAVTGLDMHYAVHANWQVLVQAIDAIGGIDVKVEVWDGSPYMYDVATKVRYKNGEVAHMNGEQALAFSRARGSAGGIGLSGGNFDRERNQQKVLQATIEKINASKFDVSKLMGISNALGDNVKTTFKTNEYQTLADLALAMNSSNIKSLPLVNAEKADENFLTTGMIGGISVVLPTAGTFDYSDIQAYIAKNTISNDISDEKAKIIVLNGTQITGLAAEQQRKLSAEGYNIVEIDSAPSQDYKTSKIFAINSEKSATIKKLEEKFNAAASSEIPQSFVKYKQSADIILVLGED